MTLIEASRKKDWGIRRNDGYVEPDELRNGALMRIADACEKMALNHAELVRERDLFEKQYGEAWKRIEAYRRQNAALKGVITKLRAQIADKDGSKA